MRGKSKNRNNQSICYHLREKSRFIRSTLPTNEVVSDDALMVTKSDRTWVWHSWNQTSDERVTNSVGDLKDCFRMHRWNHRWWETRWDALGTTSSSSDLSRITAYLKFAIQMHDVSRTSCASSYVINHLSFQPYIIGSAYRINFSLHESVMRVFNYSLRDVQIRMLDSSGKCIKRRISVHLYFRFLFNLHPSRLFTFWSVVSVRFLN